MKIQKIFPHRKKKETKNLSVDKDYYKPIKTKSAFNGNYIEYASKTAKDKTFIKFIA